MEEQPGVAIAHKEILDNIESQRILLRSESQDGETATTQPNNVFDIDGSNLSGASIGAKNYNLQKQDFAGADLKGAHFGTRIINKTYITKYDTDTEKESNAEKNFADLSDSLRVFKSDPICERAHIYRGEQKSMVTGSRPIVIKFLPYNSQNIKEAKILLKLAHHPNVVSIIHSDVYNEGPFSKRMYIAMELCHAQNLENWVKEHKLSRKSFEAALRISMAKELINGLAFIHSKSVIHRDLKPSNILLTHDRLHVKITDFGLSKELRHGCSVTAQSIARVGTDGFRAPETYLHDIISQQADIFSLGLVMYFLWSNGLHPFGAEPDLWNYNIKMSKNLNLEGLLINHVKKATNMLNRMLKFEPYQRPSADELKGHALFQYSVVFSSQDEVMLIYDEYSEHFHLYNPETKQWKEIQISLRDLNCKWFSIVSLNGYVYMLAGCTKSTYRLKYTDSSSTLERMADMLKDHGFCPPAAALNDCIYVCGGNFPVTTYVAEMFDSRKKTWTYIQDLEFARTSVILVPEKGGIYCLGGQDTAGNILNLSLKYDRKSNTWQKIKHLLSKTCLGSAVKLDDFIYVSDDIGIQMFDIPNETWSCLEIASEWPFIEGKFVKSLVVNGELFLVGITTQRKKLSVFKFNIGSRSLTLTDEITGKQFFRRAWIVTAK
uniref:calcium/calmodulin-dependent protein kinase type II subunit gamma-like isoform X1 n=1 Tax=Styela clava TaxID=7725 RepID=UPI00193ACC0E|nr:calcium/calmodulin-dependent protein kinase type II subunit gamma-like isoform X1 [Styela clava]